MDRLRHYHGNCILMLICLLLGMYGQINTADATDPLPRENVRVGFFAFEGYHMMNANGRRDGYGYDLLQYLGRYTNWRYEYIGYDKSWEEMQSMLESGEIDLLTSAQDTPARREKFEFSSRPIGTSSTVLSVRAGDNRFMTGDYATYDGMRVGLLRGNSRNGSFARFAEQKGFSYVPVYFSETEELAKALQEGDQIDGAVTSSLRRLDNEWILEEFDPRPFYVIVKKGNTQLIDEVDNALNQLDYYSPGWRLSLFKKYNERADTSENIPLMKREREYLKMLKQEQRVFKVVMNPDIPPYAYYDEDGEACGILPELFAIIARRAGIEYEFVPSSTRAEYEQQLADGVADIDLTSYTDYDAAEKNNIELTRSFFDTSLSFVARKEFSGMPKTLALPAGCVADYIKDSDLFSGQVTRVYPSVDACVQAVLDGECDAACLFTYRAQKVVRENVKSELRTASLPGTSMGICLGISTNNDYRLLSVLNKSVESIHGSSLGRDIALKYILNIPDPPFSMERYFYHSPQSAAAISVLVLIVLVGIFLNRQHRRMARRDHERRMELERFLGYVCRANDLVLEVDIESQAGRRYHLQNGIMRTDLISCNIHDYLALVHPEERAHIETHISIQALRKLIQDHKDDYFECRLQTGDGSYHWYSHDILSIPQSNLHPHSVILFRRDIDGAKKSEEIQHQAIRDALETAQRASEAKGNFLSRMSHEIRTPLNAIIGYLTLAQLPDASAGKIQHCLANGEAASRHLLHIINDVLDISAIESGRFKIAQEEFNLRQQLAPIATMFYGQARDKDILFSTSVQDVDTEWLIGDPLRIKQILMNILSNAIKFTPEKGSVRVKLQQMHPSASQVLLKFTVQDTGIGMSEAYLARIFTPFEQESAQTAQQFGGTGLGLSITQNLVRLMHGSIDVQSKLGEGSVFTISLPLKVAQHEDEADDETVDSFEHVHALVVDDLPSECDYVTSLLTRCHVASDYVLTGEEAVSRIIASEETAAAYDFCILDWKMPGMDGVETARKIKAACKKEIPIIIITAYDTAEVEEAAQQAGVRKVCSKPLFPSTMFDLLMTYFGKRKKADILPMMQQENLKDLHILLVEDNEMNREIAVAILEESGMKISTAIDGKDAVARFTEAAPGTYDCIFMDIQMPVMDGYAATRAIRSSAHPEARTIPIIAVTADVFAEDVSRALACGMNDYISKPIDYHKLITALLKFTNPARKSS